MEYFDGVKKNFGFGCMRLPMKGEKVDYEEFPRMIDYYLAEGFNYFDTAQKIRIRVCRFSEKIFFVGQYGEKGGIYARKHARKSERFVSAEIHVHADSRIAARFHVLFHFG